MAEGPLDNCRPLDSCEDQEARPGTPNLGVGENDLGHHMFSLYPLGEQAGNNQLVLSLHASAVLCSQSPLLFWAAGP